MTAQRKDRCCRLCCAAFRVTARSDLRNHHHYANHSPRILSTQLRYWFGQHHHRHHRSQRIYHGNTHALFQRRPFPGLKGQQHSHAVVILAQSFYLTERAAATKLSQVLRHAPLVRSICRPLLSLYTRARWSASSSRRATCPTRNPSASRILTLYLPWVRNNKRPNRISEVVNILLGMNSFILRSMKIWKMH